VLWELERILARENPRGVTVIVPPTEPGDLEQRWETFLLLAKNHRVWRLAQHLDPTALLLLCAMDGRSALAIAASRPDGAAYAMAFSVCAALEAGTLQPPM
jgi:S-formylglutathione hydrolase FrmB